jgi:hypothetical protein
MPRRTRVTHKAALILIGCIIMASALYAFALRYLPLEASRPGSGEPGLSPVQPRGAVSAIITRPLMITWGELEVLDQQAEPTDTKADQEEPPVIVTPPIKSTAEPRSGVMARVRAPTKIRLKRDRSNLPVAPERGDVFRVMRSIRGAVQQCYDTGMVPGEVTLTLTVSGRTGRVRQAEVSETSSTATCIQRLARRLRFPRFAKEKITIEYPYFFK